MDKARDEVLKEARGKIVTETDISFGSYPGREIVADSAIRDPRVYDGLLRARLFLVNARIYIVETYAHNQNWGDTMSTMEPFLNSFYIEQ